MLKFWPQGPPDQVTPKASSQPQTNPFDTLHHPAGGQQQQAAAAAASSAPAPAPTAGAAHHHHQAAAAAGSSSSTHAHGLGGGSIHSGLRTPTTADFPVPFGGPASSGTTAAPTTSLSIHPPDFRIAAPPIRRLPTSPAGAASSLSLTQPSLSHAHSYSGTASPSHGLFPPDVQTPTTSSSPHHAAAGSSHLSTSPGRTGSPATSSGGGGIKGHLTIKLMGGRNLAIPEAVRDTSRPYVVVQFENSEFVSREPIENALEPAAKGSAKYTPSAPPTPVGGGILSMGSISRAFDMAARSRSVGFGRGKLSLPEGRSGATTPRGEDKKEFFAQGATGGMSALSSAATAKPSASEPVWKHEVTFDLINDQSPVYLTVYDRAQEGEGFLGMRELKPLLTSGQVVDSWFRLQSRGTEQVSGEVRIQMRFDAAGQKVHLVPKDFEFLKLIGRGTFGRVFQVRKRDTKRIYAMKVLSKKEIIAKKEVAHTIGERKILQASLLSPFLVGLKFSFQTEKQLYFVTDYKSGGELFWHLQKEGRFTEERARFYIAELVLALEHLHKYDIVYRDLKPENILLDATGHVALCDFGLSKPDLASDQLTNTFCGTTEYLAPEVLLDDNGYSKLVDFWSLGVLLFEMCCGWSPFYAEDTQQMYKNICFGKIRFPRGVIDEDGKQFVKGLLNRNPKHRLGATRDAAELKEHAFFKSVDWAMLAVKQVTPPFKPVVESDESTANFDPEFTNTNVESANPFEDDEPADWAGKSDKHGAVSIGSANVPVRPGPKPIDGSPLTSSVQAEFLGFTYSGEASVLHNPADILIDDGDDEGALEEDDDALEDDDYDDEAYGSDDDDGVDEGTFVRGVLRRPGDDVDDEDTVMR